MMRKINERGSLRLDSRRRGSVMIEAALVSVFVLIPLTLAIIQYGIIFNATNTLSQVTREGARAAAVFALKTADESPGINQTSDQYIISRIQAAAAPTSLDMSDAAIARGDVTISITPAMNSTTSTPRVEGQPIQVSISYNMRSKYFFPWLTGGHNPNPTNNAAYKDGGGFVAMPAGITRTSTMMIE